MNSQKIQPVVAVPTARTFPNVWTLPRALNLDWAYAIADKRDLRLDLLRGFAVFAMVVDHFGGSSCYISSPAVTRFSSRRRKHSSSFPVSSLE